MSWFSFEVPGPIRGKARPRIGRIAGFARMIPDKKTETAEGWVRQCLLDQVGRPVLEGPLFLSVDVRVAVPASWSRYRREAAFSGALLPTGKPDGDNVVKLASDALNGFAWRDDAQIVRISFSKVYADLDGATVQFGLVPLPEAPERKRAARRRPAADTLI